MFTTQKHFEPSPRRISRRVLGVTLVELLIVIGVMVMLLSILLVALTPSLRQAKVMQTENRMRQIQLALSDYHLGVRTYPSTTTSHANDVTSTDSPSGAKILATALLGELEDGVAQGFYQAGRRYGPYMDFNAEWIIDSNDDDSIEYIQDIWGNPILYYHRVANRIPDGTAGAPPLWGNGGRFDTTHNQSIVADAKVDETYLTTDEARTVARSARYIIVSAGPDREFGTEDDMVQTGP